MKIGFIGTGIMGSRMAAHLQTAGHQLIIHNRTKEKAQDLLDNGAQWAATPAEVGQQVDLIVTMLAHPQAVQETALGADGFLGQLPEDALWVDSSTVNPSFSRTMAEAAAAHHVRFLDAPVAGSKNQAAEGVLVFLVGGASADVEVCRPLFEAMGSRVVHVGENGQGTAIKVVINQLLAQSMAAFAEGLVLGEALGLPQEMLLNILLNTPVVPAYLAGKREKLESGDYPAEFPLRWMQKDLQMSTTAAYEVGVATPLANAAKDTFQLAIRHGYGDDDFAAVYAFLSETA